MLFNQVSFFIFISIFLILYYAVPIKLQKHVLLIGNMVFLLYHSIWSLAVILLMSVIGYFCGRFMSEWDRRFTKAFLVVSICLTVGLLLFFKYSNKTMDSIVVPLGISFYSLRLIGYLVDVYKGMPALKNFEDFLAFASYFPILPAGPIERSEGLIKDLSIGKCFDADLFEKGLIMMLYGYFLKFVVADRIKILVDAVYGDINAYPGYICLLIIILYSVEIYGDFAGYSYIAIGLSYLLGIKVMTNFLRPYLADGVRTFWRRWHISLSSWLRDYVYIPLGGNRKGKLRQNINLMITFLISGLWHGFGWNFIAWGGLHGLYQVIENMTGKKNDKDRKNTTALQKVSRWIRVIVVFVLVTIAWVFFRSSSVGEAFLMLSHVVTDFGADRITDGTIYTLGWGRMQIFGIALSCLAVFVFELFLEKGLIDPDRFRKGKTPKKWVVCYVALIWIVITLIQIYGMNEEATFIYANF